MTDKNKDSLVKDILDMVSTSSNDFLQGLFPEKIDPSNKKRPPTAGDKIKVSWALEICRLAFMRRSACR